MTLKCLQLPVSFEHTFHVLPAYPVISLLLTAYSNLLAPACCMRNAISRLQ